MKNCFNFTYEKLKELGYQLPRYFKDYDCESEDVLENHVKYRKNKLHFRYFESFCKEVDKAKKNDIVLHDGGVGIAIDETFFTTLNHLGKIKVRNIRKKYCKIMRII